MVAILQYFKCIFFQENVSIWFKFFMCFIDSISSLVWVLACQWTMITHSIDTYMLHQASMSYRAWYLSNVYGYFGNLAHDQETRQIWGIWKLRPAYSPETPNLGQNRWCFVPCDLEIWWMTMENNRAPLLCCFKLCATFHSHRWIQTGVAVRKRPIWVKFDDF